MMGTKMMIVMRRDLKMRKGKIAAQAGHACVDAILAALKKEDRLGDIEMTQIDKNEQPRLFVFLSKFLPRLEKILFL